MLEIQDDIKYYIIIFFLFKFINKDLESFNNLNTLISITSENIKILLHNYFKLVKMKVIVENLVKFKDNHFNVNKIENI